jgi:putative ABC transport system permease protein
MKRNKVYSIINILGLSVGLACCLMLVLYIQDEASYDKHHQRVEDIYQVTSIIGNEGEQRIMRSSSAPIVWGIKDELPEIEKVTRLVNPPGVSQNLIRYEDKLFYEGNGFIADSTLFDIFHYEFKSGNPKKVLVEANSIVITDELARKIFGNEPALDKIISVNQGGPVADFKVTGVLAPKQKNSHIQANFFVSMTSSGWAEYLRSPGITSQWAGQNFLLSYIKLKPGTSADDFLPKMNKVFLKHGAESLKAIGMKKTLGLQPVKDIHLYATYGVHSPRVTYLYVIGSIAAFILLIACINFMNLSTAKATKRANEVGLRKTLGANRTSLIKQFLGETMFIVAIAVVLSLGIVRLLLPYFNHLTQKRITLDATNLGFFFLMLTAITAVTGLVAGAYPALYLSSFQPAKVLKGKLALNTSGGLLRQSLVVFQFVIAIMLVCGIFMITKQLKFMMEKNLGFDAEHKIILPLRSDGAREQHATLHAELQKLASVKEISGSSFVPGMPVLMDFRLYREGSSAEKATAVKNSWIEGNFMDVLEMKLIAGRKFTDNRNIESQGNKVIVNRTAAKELGFEPDEIVGQTLYNDHTEGRAAYEVIGVMEDYHQEAVKHAIYPLLFRVPDTPAEHHYMIVNVISENTGMTIAEIAEIWKRINPDTPFDYTFLDENVKKQYDDDRRVAQVITGFTIVAMIISCLGLYGLSTYMAERRFKEIGIRKVLGATVSQIVGMMSSEFTRLVTIAFVISVPLAWYGISLWLDGFAYKTTVDFMLFLLAGAAALAIALLTVSFESIRAASGDPVDALRSE